MDFNECLSACSSVRSQFARLFLGVPESFKFSCDGDYLLFLSAVGGRGNSLYSVRLESGKGKEWQKLSSSGGPRQLSRSEQLLRERMRATGSGISNYDYRREEDQLFIQDGPRCSLVHRDSESEVAVFPEFPGAVDYKLCPHTPTLAACVDNNDLWLLDASNGKKYQLTHTAVDRRQTKISAGHPSFIIQEEFDRYTGFWWQPVAGGGGVYRILYEEVCESGVEVMFTFNPSTQSVEDYRYPRPGTRNATSALKLLEFHFTESGELETESKTLSWRFPDCFPDGEYLTRAGWLPQGESVWVQLLDRLQSHLQLAVIGLEAFGPAGEDKPRPLPYVLWEEKSEHWINVVDILEFLPASSEHALRFLCTSETGGFRHLYLVEATPPQITNTEGNPPFTPSRASCKSRQLTMGNWVVFGAQVWVDEAHSLVYFEGNRGSCQEKHLFAVDLGGTEPCEAPVQLTETGFHHSTTVDVHCSRFVSVFSSESCAPRVAVYGLAHSPPSSHLLCTVWEGPELPACYTPPSSFSLPSETGEELLGVVYPPAGSEEGKKYPTVLYVYGGPAIQVVTRGLSRFLPRIQPWIQQGFAVVMLDNRGSYHRGKAFEAHIKGCMGAVELKDQVAGIRHASQQFDFIDLSRVAIAGWSYGGYMALMGLARFPDVFKVAIAGAPVTEWMVYDTGYTERYLGVPPRAGLAYLQSSVLTYAAKFPTEPNRMLVLHGMNDENVLFTHTSLLVDQLMALGKPYQLQVYTGERHGLRSLAAASHCNATILSFMLQHL